MKPKQIMLANVLTYAGTLPLLAAALGPLLSLATPAHAMFIATTYSAIIITFLAGMHWAVYVFFADTCPRNLLLTSNAAALLAWLSLLWPEQPWGFLLQNLCFLYLLTLDYKLHAAGILPQWFYALRRNATVIVVLSLSIMMGQL
jgi:Protein of unknown function (DUF3429)